MQTSSPFIVGVDYKAIFLSPQTEREQEPDIDTGNIRSSSRLNPKRQASQSVYRYSDDDSYLPPIFSSEITEEPPNLPLLAFFEDDLEDSMNTTSAGAVNNKDQSSDFQLFKPTASASASSSKDACSYDLRDQQEPATLNKEYPNYGSNKDNTSSNDLYDVDTKKDIKSQLEAEPGPVCFPSVSPTPDSPSRLNTELHIHHNNQGDSSKKLASSDSPKDIKPTIPAALAINSSNTPSSVKGPASNTSSSSSGNSTSGIPVDPQLAGGSSQQPQSAMANYFDVSGMSNINNNGSNVRPMARAGQPSFLKDMGDGMIRTPGPGQMVSPKETFMDFNSLMQTVANGNNNGPQQQQQTPASAATDQAAQSLMAALGQAHQQHQLQQQLQQQLNNQNNGRQQSQINYPFPTNFQVKPEALSTDIAVPSSASTLNNNGSNPLPPLPTNYQPPPAPLNFQDGSFFSHQAILASLAAEDNARLAAAINLNSGNYGGFNTGSYMPTFPPTSTAGDVSVAQHFSQQQQQQPSTSVHSTPGNNTSDSSRKRGRGGNSKARQQQQQQDNQRQGLTRENSGSQQPPSSVRSTYDMEGDEHNPFHTDASSFFNLGDGLDIDIEAAKNYNDQMQAAGIPIPQSSRTSSRAAKKKAQQGADMGDFPIAGTSNTNNNNVQGTGATRFGTNDEDTLHDSSFSTEEDDEWVAEDSDDSFGKPAKKKGKKSGAGGTTSTANNTTSSTTTKASKTTKNKKHSKKDSVNSNNSTAASTTAVPPLPPSSYGQFNFSSQFGPDGMYVMPPALDHTPQQSPQQPTKSENGTHERRTPATPGTGSIVCDYVDPSTGVVCQVRFRRPYDQARHLETVHGVGTEDKPKSVCYTCKKSFSRKDALIRHGRISGHTTFLPPPPDDY